MYPSLRPAAVLGGRGRSGDRRGTPASGPPVSANVVFLGPDEPVHRHLLGDGHGHPADLSALPAPVLVSRVRVVQRSLPRRVGAHDGGGRGDRRPARPLQRGRGRRLRNVGGVQARTARGAQRAVARVDRAVRRPRRQGCAQRAARRADLVERGTETARHRVRRAPRVRHRGRGARARWSRTSSCARHRPDTTRSSSCRSCSR